MGAFPAAQRDMARLAALRRAASLGIAAVHECGGPGMSDENDFTRVLALGRDATLPDVFGYWGELGSAGKARGLGAIGAGGDIHADGALASRTAHLRTAYPDTVDRGHGNEAVGADHRGHAYLIAEQAGAHLIDCSEHGSQGGFRASGDAAIGAILRGFAIASDKVGIDRVRAARHRIEQAEIMDKQLIAGFVEYGIVASVQPALDRLWGGERGTYARCLGAERAFGSNPVGALLAVGASVALGSNSPATPLDPWATIRAAMQHHNPAHRIGVKAAFAAHTRGGWRAVHRDNEGVIAFGATATFAVWDIRTVGVHELPSLISMLSFVPHPCLRTVVRGTTIFMGDTAR